MAQKFIITLAGYFKLGDVRMHRDLLDANDVCIGGGFYEVDYLSGRLLLDRRSYDYGPPRWRLLIGEEKPLIVPAAYRGMQIVYEPEDRYDETLIISELLRIVYV